MQQVSVSVLRPSEASAFVNTCRLIGIYRGSRDDSFGLVQSSVVQHWQCGCRLVSKQAARLAQRRPQGALLMNTTCAPRSKRHNPIPRDEMPRGSSIEPDHARKWDPVTLKAADGTRHVRRWIRDRDCSKALVRRHWRSGSLTSRCNRELEAMVAG
jgi:hypothetical protein